MVFLFPLPWSMEKVCEPLHHDAAGEVGDGDELAGNGTWIGVEAGVQCSVIQVQAIGGDRDTFIRPQRARGSSRFNHAESNGSNHLIVSTHHHRSAGGNPQHGGRGAVQFSRHCAGLHGKGQSLRRYPHQAKQILGPDMAVYIEGHKARCVRVVDQRRKAQLEQQKTGDALEAAGGIEYLRGMAAQP